MKTTLTTFSSQILARRVKFHADEVLASIAEVRGGEESVKELKIGLTTC